MAASAPIAVIIPTYARGAQIVQSLQRILDCDPRPSEIWVHVDQSTGELEALLSARFPMVQTLRSPVRLGPGGGRHACMQRVTTPFVASFDDDSWPFDRDFFARAVALFSQKSDAAVIGASIWHRHQAESPRRSTIARSTSFTGCGVAMRVSAYRAVAGYVPRPVAYGLEETDLSMQMYAAGLSIYESQDLRVFHNTELRHHDSADITEGIIANTALLAFLRYPAWLWGWGLLQLASAVRFSISRGRWRGILSGLARIPGDCWSLRRYRHLLPGRKIWEYLRWRRSVR